MKLRESKCECGGSAVYFGEALYGSLRCNRCEQFLCGVGLDFCRSIFDRWDAGERGDQGRVDDRELDDGILEA